MHILRLVVRGRAKPHNAHVRTPPYARVLHEPCVPGNGETRRYMGSKLHTDAATVGEARWLEGRRRRGEERGKKGIEMRVATRGGQNMCVRGEVGAVAQRGSIFPIANFALRFSSPSPCPTRTLSSPIHPISRRAPRFPRRTIHSSAPALFQPPLLPPMQPSLSIRPSPPRYIIQRAGDQTGGAAADTIKTWKKRWPTYTRTDVNGERKSPADRVLGYPYGGGTEESRRFSEQLFMKHLTRFHDRDSFFLLPLFRFYSSVEGQRIRRILKESLRNLAIRKKDPFSPIPKMVARSILNNQRRQISSAPIPRGIGRVALSRGKIAIHEIAAQRVKSAQEGN